MFIKLKKQSDLVNHAVEAKIDEIADVINKRVVNRINSNLFYFENGLYTGDAGDVLFLHFYAKFFNRPDINDNLEVLLERLISNYSSLFSGYSYCSGFSGVLYLFQTLKTHQFIEIDTSDIESQIDEYLEVNIDADIQHSTYDFMHGSLGVGLYYLKAAKRNDIIEKIIAFLLKSAQIDTEKETISWQTNIMGNKLIAENISLSHGIPSIIVFLTRLLNTNHDSTKIRELLLGAINYVLSQQIDFDQYGSCFPTFPKNTHPIERSRLAWCYGDLGIALSLKQAGTALEDSNLVDKSIAILLKNSKRRDSKDTLINDAGICHGSAGVAMMYRRMFKDTHIPEFKECHEFWIKETLNHAKFNDGLCGYKNLVNDQWTIDYGLLSGVSGIGLVLMSYLFDDEQLWDELFLVSSYTPEIK